MTVQLSSNHASVRSARPTLRVGFAQSAWEIRAAQRLRFQVFAEEMGARLPNPQQGIDEDAFDLLCEHLIVRDQRTDKVVGTYQILSPASAQRIGRYYADGEFDLGRLATLRPQLVEIGRACVHPDYRSGATITLLWSGLARYMRLSGHEFLFGCASIGMADGGHAAASLYRRLQGQLAPAEYRVFPRCALPLEALRSNVEADLPPLIKGYLRAGAMICGAPAWDPDFNTADLPMLLQLRDLPEKYRRHFLGH